MELEIKASYFHDIDEWIKSTNSPYPCLPTNYKRDVIIRHFMYKGMFPIFVDKVVDVAVLSYDTACQVDTCLNIDDLDFEKLIDDIKKMFKDGIIPHSKIYSILNREQIDVLCELGILTIEKDKARIKYG